MSPELRRQLSSFTIAQLEDLHRALVWKRRRAAKTSTRFTPKKKRTSGGSR